MFFKNRKGLSEVVGAVIMIALVIGLIAGVWTIVNSFVADRLDKTESCYAVIGKTTLNPLYTCYNETGNYLMVSINVGEIELDSLFLSIETNGSSQVFQLKNESQILDNITFYNPDNNEVYMPRPESGKAYIIDAQSRPSRIQIAPRMGTTTCDVSDMIDSIATCA